MADPKGFEPLQLVVKIAINLLEAQQGLGLNRVPPARCIQPTLGKTIELVMQFGNPFGLDGESTGGGMAPKALEERGALLEGLIHRKSLG
jgi:hypothetical protein